MDEITTVRLFSSQGSIMQEVSRDGGRRATKSELECLAGAIPKVAS
jgi:hypothetical protein